VNYRFTGEAGVGSNGVLCDKVARPKWDRILDGARFGVASNNLPSATR
jgi:hypothetical protein